jgi:hypothetical protein
VLHEQVDLLRRFAAAALDRYPAGVAKIGRIKFANPVVTQSRAGLDRPGPGLVANHAECQLELPPLAGITVIGEFHI